MGHSVWNHSFPIFKTAKWTNTSLYIAELSDPFKPVIKLNHNGERMILMILFVGRKEMEQDIIKKQEQERKLQEVREEMKKEVEEYAKELKAQRECAEKLKRIQQSFDETMKARVEIFEDMSLTFDRSVKRLKEIQNVIDEEYIDLRNDIDKVIKQESNK